MAFHGCFRDDQVARNLFGAETPGQEGQDVQLAVRQGLDQANLGGKARQRRDQGRRTGRVGVESVQDLLNVVRLEPAPGQALQQAGQRRTQIHEVPDETAGLSQCHSLRQGMQRSRPVALCVIA